MKTRYLLKNDQSLDVSGLRLFLFNRLAAQSSGGGVTIRAETAGGEVAAVLDKLGRLFAWLEVPGGEELVRAAGGRSAEGRMAAYKKRLDQLMAEGKAYPCYCSEERLKEVRSRQTVQGKRPRYDGHCRDLTPAQQKELAGVRTPQARVRLDPEGPLSLHDQVGGERSLPKNLIEDFVIARSDGSVSKNFAVAVDDLEEGITDLIVEEGELPNIFQQSIFWKLMVNQEPRVTLIPVLLDTDHGLLSKKGAEVAVERFQQEGFLPRALIRYLISSGWPQSLTFPLEELPEKFKEATIVRSSPVFDIAVLRDINGKCLQEIPEEVFLGLARPYLQGINEARAVEIARGVRSYLKTLAEIGVYGEILRPETLAIPADFIPILRTERAKNSLRYVIQAIEPLESLAPDTIAKSVESAAAKFKIKPKSIWSSLQIALTGEGSELVLDPVPHLMGKDKVMARLQSALATAEAPPPPAA